MLPLAPQPPSSTTDTSASVLLAAACKACLPGRFPEKKPGALPSRRCVFLRLAAFPASALRSCFAFAAAPAFWLAICALALPRCLQHWRCPTTSPFRLPCGRHAPACSAASATTGNTLNTASCE